MVMMTFPLRSRRRVSLFKDARRGRVVNDGSVKGAAQGDRDECRHGDELGAPHRSVRNRREETEGVCLALEALCRRADGRRVADAGEDILDRWVH